MKKRNLISAIFIFILILSFIFLNLAKLLKNPDEDKSGEEGDSVLVITCDIYQPDECPEECVVCPPCMACSSISCQTEEFCAEMGIDRSWYEGIQARVTNFQECIGAGNPAMESYPRQCRAGDQTFVEEVENIE